MLTDQELIYTMALTRLLPFSSANRRTLLEEVGSATAVFENRHELAHMMEHFSPRATMALDTMEREVPRCEEELRYARDHKIEVLAIHDQSAYPTRLRQCEDAPIVLYHLGKGDLQARHIISIVGTRRCTEMGRELCNRLAADLARLRPDVLVISGLAYGIDIAAHRAALNNGLATAAVLAHGLDEIYPPLHRQTAIEMLQQGGLITEYMSNTHIEKVNFVQRNRIVAGLSDATVVVESAKHGGSLITAEMAGGYNREVMAFPGRVFDSASAGCNQLIRSNAAHLITSAEDLLSVLGWESQQQPDGQATIDFASGSDGDKPNLSAEEQKVLQALHDSGGDSSLSDLIVHTAMPVAALTPLLLTMEMRGLIKKLAGNRYHRIRT